MPQFSYNLKKINFKGKCFFYNYLKLFFSLKLIPYLNPGSVSKFNVFGSTTLIRRFPDIPTYFVCLGQVSKVWLDVVDRADKFLR